MEGYESKDWKLVDAIHIIVHLFHPEKRSFYDLEKMWSEELPKEKALYMKKYLIFISFIYFLFFLIQKFTQTPILTNFMRR